MREMILDSSGEPIDKTGVNPQKEKILPPEWVDVEGGCSLDDLECEFGCTEQVRVNQSPEGSTLRGWVYKGDGHTYLSNRKGRAKGMDEWKKVKEEPPPYCEEVLIYAKGMGVTGAYLMECNLWGIIDWDEYEQHLRFDDVEYWMYPPKKPKKPESQEGSE